MVRDVVQALFFYPRGGSAQVIRYLSAALRRQGSRTRVVSGSFGQPGGRSHAGTFFRDLEVLPVDYTAAIEAAERGEDPFSQPVPLHPSYEDRVDAVDRVFTSIEPSTGEYLERTWATLLSDRIDAAPELFHVHHLTPLQAAVRANWPEAPMIGHIHGTELGMLREIKDRMDIVDQLGLDLEHDADCVFDAAQAAMEQLTDDQHEIVQATRWEYWRYAAYWAERLRYYASLCDHLILLSDDMRESVQELLGFEGSYVTAVPNGVDISRFYPDPLSHDERLRRWRHWLVEDPHGWDESGEPGTVGYSESEVERWFNDETLEQSTVLLFVGRFISMKRVPLLIRAYRRAQQRFDIRAPLVIWGGNPGEWEGEHPVTVAREEGVEGVFFVGWRGHSELPSGLNAADVMVAPSTSEPFGQVYIEAMACGLPVIATRSGGPPTFVNTHEDAPNGWLIPPDDEDALVDVLVEVVNTRDTRRQRGANAYEQVRQEYSWDSIAKRVLELYASVVEDKRRELSG